MSWTFRGLSVHFGERLPEKTRGVDIGAKKTLRNALFGEIKPRESMAVVIILEI
jgi:hypothetical protein